MGTARFLAWMTVIIICWVLWNVPFGPPRPRFDEYPFIFLTLVLSLQASYAAPLILLAQNRQESRDRVAIERDREQAAQSRADMDFLAREIAGLRMSVGELATRDYLRSELRSELRSILAELDDEDRERERGGRDRDGRRDRDRWVTAPAGDRRRPGVCSATVGGRTCGSQLTWPGACLDCFPLLDRVRDALTRVNDPEIQRPITDLGMVAAVEEAAAG